jgi:hypothetical protein
MKSFSLMQPHFFPYIGYFYLIFNTDVFVYYDSAQLSRQSWQTRNRLLDENGKVKVLALPVTKSETPESIAQAKISCGTFLDQDYLFESIINRVESYYRRSPHLSSLHEYLNKVFYCSKTSLLIDLNIASIQHASLEIAKRTGISPEFQLFSDIMKDIPDIMSRERVSRIALCGTALHCTDYVTPIGSIEYMLTSASLNDLNNFELHVLAANQVRYAQVDARRRPLAEFVPNLSIIDLLAQIGWDGIADCLTSQHLFDVRDFSSFQTIN